MAFGWRIGEVKGFPGRFPLCPRSDFKVPHPAKLAALRAFCRPPSVIGANFETFCRARWTITPRAVIIGPSK